MATTKKKRKFKKVRLFKVQRFLNVSADTLVEYLEEEGYGEALKGKGLNAKITDEEAYLDLLEAFAEDQETRERVREMRADREGERQEDGAEEQTEAVAEQEAVSGDGETAVVQEEPEPEDAQPRGDEEEAVAEEAPVEEPVAEEEADTEQPEEAAAARADGEAVEEKAEEPATQAEEETEEPVAQAEQDEAATEPEAASIESEEPETAEPEEAPAEETVEEEAEAEKAEDTEAAAAEDEDTIKANRYKLSGPQRVGQVNIEDIKKKARERRKKRKRKRKERKREKKQKKKKRKKGKGKPKVDEEDIEEQIQKTLSELEQGASRIRSRRRRRRRERHERERQRELEKQREEARTLRITEYVSTGELANLIGEDVNDVIGTLMEAGRMVSINQRLDSETIAYVADEYDMEVDFIDEYEAEEFEAEEEDAPEDLEPRAPVITVMGHVDHGKTSLLDYIREANVVAGEAGGITQHIGAHRVQLPNSRDITFLDTPGHEAFTAMRARGAKSTDLVILVVAADDSVMPQTIEAINHAQAAEVPIIVAINKMDLPEADPQRVMQELAEHNVLVEQYGGKVQCAQISAETGEGIDDLLEKVLLEADLMELEANPNRLPNGTIVESRLEKGRGRVATVLVQNGTLRVGDPFVAGVHSGRVRAMFDERDNPVEEVGPSQPALVLGFDGSPEVGDQFVAVEEESTARDVAQRRQEIHREQALRQQSHLTLDEIGRRLAVGEYHELNLIIKADVGGSVEAVADALMKLKTEEVAVNVIHTGVGAITENDVMLAAASEAVILGFQVRPRPGARKLAEQEEIDIRTYSIIYEAVEDVRKALEGLLTPERNEETLGMAEVRDTFSVPNVGTVAGAYVTEGRIHRNDQVRLLRDGVVIYDGTISSLKRYKDDVREVQSGYEFGIGIENYDDIKVDDEIEAYEVVETRRTLEV